MKLLKNLFYEQYKNIKILFRNLSSVFLLIIGPLALILLIGFAYSGDSIHDINIGVVSSDYSSLEPAFANFSSFATIYRYDTIASCVDDINIQKMHLCLEFSEHFVKTNGTEIPSGAITFYFDNSRKSLSNKIVDSLSSYFGIEAEKISIESAKTIFANVQTLVIYLEQKNQDIDSLINESYSLKQDLVDRHERLVEIRDEFLPVYNKSKQLQARMDNLSVKANDSYSAYKDNSDELLKDLKLLKKQLRKFDVNEYYFYYDYEEGLYRLTSNITLLGNITYYNLSYYNYSIDENNLTVFFDELFEGSLANISEIEFDLSELEEDRSSLTILASIAAIDAVEESMTDFTSSTEEYYNYTQEQKNEFDNAVLLLDNVKEMLDLDIKSTEEYIVKVDESVVKVSEIQRELNSSLVQLSKLEPGLAEKLIKPILQNFEPVLPGIENIKLAFPSMLAIIIIFISILFANIVTLTEINSKAFYRNLIAPVNSLLFIAGLIITNIFVVFFQISVLLLVGQFSFKLEIFSAFFDVSVIIILLSLIFISIGMIIAVLLKNSQTSILTTTFLALGFFLFSDSVAPLETMPVLAAFFAAKNPFVIASLAFKKILIFRIPLGALMPEISILGIYLLIGLVSLVVISVLRLKDSK